MATDTQTNEVVSAPEYEEDDELLPIGYAEGDDIFDQGTWTGSATDAGESTPASDNDTSSETDPEPAANSPALESLTSELKAQGVDTNLPKDASTEAPTTEQKAEKSSKLKFTARIDHKDQEIEVDEADLPTIYQKAQATDRAQARLDAAEKAKAAYDKSAPLLDKLESFARAMGYEGGDAFLTGALSEFKAAKLEELTKAGTPEEIAKDYVDRMLAKDSKHEAAPATSPERVTATGGERDFKSEVSLLLSTYPELRNKPIPDEVIKDAVTQNRHILAAYSDYEMKQVKAEREAVLKENRIYKQNAASAAKAPVSGTAKGGSGNSEPEDPFIKGFDSDDWDG